MSDVAKKARTAMLQAAVFCVRSLKWKGSKGSGGGQINQGYFAITECYMVMKKNTLLLLQQWGGVSKVLSKEAHAVLLYLYEVQVQHRRHEPLCR